MTTPRDPDSLLAAYLADGIDVLPDRVADAVLDEAHRTRQRVVFGPRRTPVMNSTIKVILAAAAVIAVVVAGISLLPRNDAAVGGPSSASPSAGPSTGPSAASPAASASPLPRIPGGQRRCGSRHLPVVSGRGDAGRYHLYGPCGVGEPVWDPQQGPRRSR